MIGQNFEFWKPNSSPLFFWKKILFFKKSPVESPTVRPRPSAALVPLEGILSFRHPCRGFGLTEQALCLGLKIVLIFWKSFGCRVATYIIFREKHKKNPIWLQFLLNEKRLICEPKDGIRGPCHWFRLKQCQFLFKTINSKFWPFIIWFWVSKILMWWSNLSYDGCYDSLSMTIT